jgi:hypothetical protein
MKGDCEIKRTNTFTQASDVLENDKNIAKLKGYNTNGYWIGELVNEGWVNLDANWKQFRTTIKHNNRITTYTGNPVKKR